MLSTLPALIVKVCPAATAVLDPSLYHLIVPKLVKAVPVTSTPALYTCAVNVVEILAFLKIVPAEEVTTNVIASAPFAPVAPFGPCGPCGPVAPVSPFAPVYPFGPCAPVVPLKAIA